MIRKKLDILLQTGVIDQDTFGFATRVLEYLINREIIADEAQSDVFITHLAMAHFRQKSGEAIESLDSEMLDQLRSEVYFDKAVTLWNEIDQMTEVTFNDTEIGYFYLHLLTMLNAN